MIPQVRCHDHGADCPRRVHAVPPLLSTKQHSVCWAEVRAAQRAGAERDEALAAFYKQYENDGLVLLKYLALRSASNVPANLNAVDGLQRDNPAFDIKNPNCCYSLYLGCVLVPFLSSLDPTRAYLRAGPETKQCLLFATPLQLLALAACMGADTGFSFDEIC